MARPPALLLHSTQVAVGESLTGCEQEVWVALGRHIINWRIAEHVAVRLLCNGESNERQGKVQLSMWLIHISRVLLRACRQFTVSSSRLGNHLKPVVQQ